MKTFIIAEAGVNHNGDMETAMRMVDAAADSGADAVKFQTFKAEELASSHAPLAGYQAGATSGYERQYEMLKNLELDAGAFRELAAYTRERGIVFLSAAFDLDSIDFLNELGIEIFKIPSGEITNLPYLRKMGSSGKKIIMSTGMADLGEIEDALDVLTGAGTPRNDITVLHCNTGYPTPFEDVNLSAMLSIREAFRVRVGYSDHTTGMEVPVAAVALGASVIEKHFTLDKGMPGPDHGASLEPHEFRDMVTAVRNIEKALGDGIKKPMPSEEKNRAAARKSIVALKDIRKGELFSEGVITAKRPGTGISPMEWDRVVGRAAAKDFRADALIEI